MRVDEKVKKKINKNEHNLKSKSLKIKQSEDNLKQQIGKTSLIKFDYISETSTMVQKRKKKRDGILDELRGEEETSDNNEMDIAESNMDKVKGNCSTDTNNKQVDANINTNSEAEKKQLKELYKHTDKGPYNILITKNNIDSYEIALKISKYRIKGINNINQVSRNTIRVNLKDYNSANKLINMNDYEDFKEFKMFIPNDYISTHGIIRNIPTYITIDEIKNNIVSDSPVIEVERMNFWNKEIKQAQPGTSIKINFRTQILPKEIKLYYVINKVELFINKPLICKRCLNYGHTKKFCKSEEVCYNCTEIKHDDNVKCKQVCKQCKTNASFTHKTADYKCPEYIEQLEIKKTMTIKKITYKEARELKNKLNGPKINTEHTQNSTKYADAVKQNLTTTSTTTNKDNKTTTSDPKTSPESEMVKNIMAIFDETKEEQCKDIILMKVLHYLTTKNQDGSKNNTA